MIDKENLSWGKPCRRLHQKEDGTNLRHFKACVMCKCAKRFEGLTQDEAYVKLTTPHVPKRTAEYVRLRHIESVVRWNARNSDKTKQYRKKYYSSDERRALMRERYAALSEEEKQVCRNRSKARYYKLKAEKTDGEKK